MKFTELKNSITGGALPVYLLEGEDAYFRQKGEEMIKDAFLQFPELNFSSFEGENLKGGNITALTSAVKNYPFMAEKRIVKVTEFYPAESEFSEYLKPLLDDFPPTAILMIINSGAKKGADLKRKKGITFVDCGKADPESVARWAYITFKQAQIQCPAAVCENLAAYCLYNMSRVALEVAKLIDYKGQGVLTEEEVDSLVYKDADYRIYEMTNAVARRDYAKYCLISADLKSKGFDEVGILNGLFSYFKNILSAALSPLTDAQYARENNLKEYSVKKNREQAEMLGLENLKRLVNITYSCISGIKSGVMTPSSALQNCQNNIFFARR